MNVEKGKNVIPYIRVQNANSDGKKSWLKLNFKRSGMTKSQSGTGWKELQWLTIEKGEVGEIIEYFGKKKYLGINVKAFQVLKHLENLDKQSLFALSGLFSLQDV